MWGEPILLRQFKKARGEMFFLPVRVLDSQDFSCLTAAGAVGQVSETVRLATTLPLAAVGGVGMSSGSAELLVDHEALDWPRAAR